MTRSVIDLLPENPQANQQSIADNNGSEWRTKMKPAYPDEEIIAKLS